jgi:hypothetical protein
MDLHTTKHPRHINTTVRVDASLVVGAAAQSVEVTGQTALLQTEGAEARSEFTTNSLSNLPLPLGRNYESLYTTIPGFPPTCRVRRPTFRR